MVYCEIKTNLEGRYNMCSKDEMLSFMDLLDLDEEIIDSRLKLIMERNSFTDKHLTSAIHLLQYKNLINLQEGSECENDAELSFLAKLISEVQLENVDKVCQIIYTVLGLNKTTLVNNSEHLIQQIFTNIDLLLLNAKRDSGDNMFEDENNLRILHSLKLCDSILDAVISSGKKMHLPLIELPLENVLQSAEDKLKIYFVTKSVPRLFQSIEGYSILDSIWNYLKKLECDDKGQALKILSCLSGFYLPVSDDKGNVKYKSEIIFYNEFWNLLLNGLMSNDPSTKKVSIYLIKRAIDCLLPLKKDFSIVLEEKTIFKWQHKYVKTLHENWNKFFILFDSLEEKQSNIVLPSLQLLDSIKRIQSCWINCVLNIGLRHDNTQVRLKCIEHRLKTKLDCQLDAITLLEALNDTNIYDDPKECEQLNIKIAESLKDENTFLYIIKSIPKIKWSPVPLFHISDILSKEHVDLKIDPTQFVAIIIDMLKVPCNAKVIRNAVKQNITYLAGQCCDGLNWKDLIDIYSLANCDWNKLIVTSKNKNPFIAKIKNLKLDANNKEEFFKVVTDSYKTIDFGLLYLENNIDNLGTFMEIIDKKIEEVQDIVNRQYSNKTECFDDVVYITHLFGKTINNCYFKDIIAERMLAQQKTIIQYTSSLFSCETLLQIEETHLIFNGLKTIVNTSKNIDVKDMKLNMYKNAILVLKNVNTNIQAKLYAILIINALNITEHNDTHEMFQLKELLLILENVKFNEIQNVDDNGRYINSFYECSCEIIYNYVISDDPGVQLMVKNNIQEIVDYIDNVIECGGYGSLEWVLAVIDVLLSEIILNEKIDFNIAQFVSRMWKEIEELKSNHQYMPCIKQFIELITEDSLSTNQMYKDLVTLYCSKIVQNGAVKISPLYYLVEELSCKDVSENSEHLISVLFNILMFSMVPRKDQRIADNVAITISQDPKYGLDCASFDVYFNFSIQYTAIITLSRIQNPEILRSLTALIINEFEERFKTKQRYHENSQYHRILLTGLQHLLFISLMSYDVLLSEKILSWSMEFLGRLPHQPSVRICLEWYISLQLHVKYISLNGGMAEMMKLKYIPIMSQLSILYWTLKHKIMNKSYTQNEFEFVMDTLLSHTMGQTFSVRLLAQYLATQLFYKADDKYRNKYTYIIGVIKKTFIESEKEKNYIKLKEDFFIQDFDIVSHLTPIFIYHFLPRYCGIGINENVNENFVRMLIGKMNSQQFIKRNNSNNFIIEWCRIRKSDDEIFKLALNKVKQNTIQSDENAKAMGTIQKKYVPWKKMSDIDVYELEKKQETSSELILVASLIDKLPNLGGMARTSEVFGVKTYVVDSLRHLQDKQFQGLSVTSERWVNIEEVRPGQPLKDYLMKKKGEGYSVVAAEQTSTSCQLQSFKFPKKTLLLLGHEKEGIPCDLLPMMDHCVEIPQQGFVRSLNVHVTAAIFVWEYSRQNML